MGQPNQLYDTYTAIGAKEDISDLIFNISPTETPVLSACGTATASQKLHQWQIDTLGTPAANTAIEGDDPDLAEPGTTTLLGNYTQISNKAFGVSGTLEVTSKYGRDSEVAYQAAKNARDLKNDVDFGITGLNVPATATVERQTASLEAWLTSNVDRSTGVTDGVNPTLSNGIPNAGATDGTIRAFAQSQLDSVIQSAWSNGGKPTMIVAGPQQKTNLSGFDGLGNTPTGGKHVGRGDRASRTIYATADTYYSNFGILNVVPSRHMRLSAGTTGVEGATVEDRSVFCLDPEYLKVAYLRTWQQFDLAKTGDSIKREMLVEWCLEVCNEAAHGIIADVGTAG